MESFKYDILNKKHKYLKIGYTNNLDSRTKAYNTHNPDYEIISTKSGTKTDEARLHKLCRNYHYDSEWFHDVPYVREVFKNYESFCKECKPSENKSETSEFYMTFVDYVKWIYGLTTITTLKVLYKLLEIAEYNTGELSLSPGKRQEIMESIGIKKSAFTKL